MRLRSDRTNAKATRRVRRHPSQPKLAQSAPRPLRSPRVAHRAPSPRGRSRPSLPRSPHSPPRTSSRARSRSLWRWEDRPAGATYIVACDSHIQVKTGPMDLALACSILLVACTNSTELLKLPTLPGKFKHDKTAIGTYHSPRPAPSPRSRARATRARFALRKGRRPWRGRSLEGAASSRSA